jgi:hypothetical protein
VKGEVALRKLRAIFLDRRVEVIHIATADLQVAVFEHGFAVNYVADVLGAEHFHFYANPLVTPVGLGSGVEAMRLDHLPIAEGMNTASRHKRSTRVAGMAERLRTVWLRTRRRRLRNVYHAKPLRQAYRPAADHLDVPRGRIKRIHVDVHDFLLTTIKTELTLA